MGFNWKFTFLSLLALSANVLTSPSISGNSDKNGEIDETFVPLVPQQSCYYESFSKRLACVCKNMDMAASLDLRVGYFVYNSGNEIRQESLAQIRQALLVRFLEWQFRKQSLLVSQLLFYFIVNKFTFQKYRLKSLPVIYWYDNSVMFYHRCLEIVAILIVIFCILL